MRSLFENYFALHENPDTESVAKCLFENVAGFALPTAREIVKRADKPLWEFIPAFFANEKIKPLVYRVLSEKHNGEYTSDHYPIMLSFDIEN